MSGGGNAAGHGAVARPFSSGGTRSRSAGRFGSRQQQQQQRTAADEQFQEEQQLGQDLNVRVRERDPTAAAAMAGEERPRSRLGSLIFKSGGDSSAPSGGGPNPGGGVGSLEQRANELKGTLARPLSSLFRRAQSKDRAHHPQHGHDPTMAESVPSSSAAAMPPRPRGPLATGGTSGNHQQQGAAAMYSGGGHGVGNANRGGGGGMPTASSAGTGANVANGRTLGGGGPPTTTTTMTRPFSGFPGKRPTTAVPAEATTDGAAGAHEMDLSEQAAIAPHINVRRFSAIANDPSSLFLTRMGATNQQQPQGSGRTPGRGSRSGGTGEIDVNFLSRFLCPEDEIQDEQIPWTWDSLFASVTSELREEWALEEEANNNNNEGGGGGGGGGIDTAPIPNGPVPQRHQGGYVPPPPKGF